LRASGIVARMVVGCAQREFLEPLIAQSGIGDVFLPLYVQNVFFGGNVDVTGLLTAQDIVDGIRSCSHMASEQARPETILFFIPSVVFNDDGITLDGATLADMEKAAGQTLHMVSCTPADYFREIPALT